MPWFRRGPERPKPTWTYQPYDLDRILDEDVLRRRLEELIHRKPEVFDFGNGDFFDPWVNAFESDAEAVLEGERRRRDEQIDQIAGWARGRVEEQRVAVEAAGQEVDRMAAVLANLRHALLDHRIRRKLRQETAVE
ncbi:hypothetical protein NI17_012350 [Thermobifida halotolerans]|uniref:Uncharacterized protein n=1 Tax=Thermobifida halotolerans TaxID=483545 RepID=A0A399G6Z3_9ACTN|nr:hypothetical protein [Thermobifida halotolerans]UOE17703.1 hypothetical protein NI17_012350 [Thermobifida halotolerans]